MTTRQSQRTTVKNIEELRALDTSVRTVTMNGTTFRRYRDPATRAVGGFVSQNATVTGRSRIEPGVVVLSWAVVHDSEILGASTLYQDAIVRTSRVIDSTIAFDTAVTDSIIETGRVNSRHRINNRYERGNKFAGRVQVGKDLDFVVLSTRVN